mmetsp:Transcript_8118/g.19508  ORF Transcript_8118/g.19508 Transcript_8118/m.19508 type:complete len:82 (-) Transcript_8118:85-330(-)
MASEVVQLREALGFELQFQRQPAVFRSFRANKEALQASIIYETNTQVRTPDCLAWSMEERNNNQQKSNTVKGRRFQASGHN